MMQASTLADFRTAWEMGKSAAKTEIKENQITPIIKAFEEDKRFNRFLEDLTSVLQESSDTLNDAHNIQESAGELALLINLLSKRHSSMLEQANEIIKQKAESGILQEGVFNLEPLKKKSNRKVNLDILKSEKYRKKYDFLLDSAKKELDESFCPTIKAVEGLFGKDVDKVLIPATVQIIGYEIKVHALEMPEQASAGVEL